MFISTHLELNDDEIELHAIRAQGHGGQNVNKVATAIHLRFDIPASSLPESVKQKLLSSGDQRISQDGVLIIKSQSSRSQQQNRQLALQRLKDFILDTTRPVKKRIATRPSGSSVKKRLQKKQQQADKKSQRKKIQIID